MYFVLFCCDIPTGEVTLKRMICFHCCDGSQINILEKVGVKYFDFGLYLLNDDNGTQLSIIEKNNKGDIISHVREIVQKWLAGNGGQFHGSHLFLS